MSIFKYFKHVVTGTEPDEHEDKGLPEPTGPLSNSVPINTIKLANVKVANVIPRNNTIRPYLMLTPTQRYKVGNLRHLIKQPKTFDCGF